MYEEPARTAFDRNARIRNLSGVTSAFLVLPSFETRIRLFSFKCRFDWHSDDRVYFPLAGWMGNFDRGLCSLGDDCESNFE